MMISRGVSLTRPVLWIWLVFFFCLVSVVHGEPLRFSADRVESVLASGREVTRLIGNARISTPRVTIQANTITISGEGNRFLEAQGQVIIQELRRNIRLSGDLLNYDRTLDVLRIRGNGILEDQLNNTLVRGSIIEHRGEENIAIIQIGVRILRDELTARADIVRYDRNTDTLELLGQPVVFSKGDEFRASRITVDLTTDDFRLDGMVQGTIRERNNQ
jgi:lipopolysaccharide export system protein LptA